MMGLDKAAGAVLAVLACAFANPVFAADAVSAQRAAAMDALNAMHMVESMRAGADAALNRSLNVDIEAHPEQAALFQAMKSKVVEIETRKLPEMLGIMADVYTAEFTVPELKAISAFYATPAGRKLVDTRTEINQKAAPAMQIWVRSVLKDLSDEMAQKLAAPDK